MHYHKHRGVLKEKNNDSHECTESILLLFTSTCVCRVAADLMHRSSPSYCGGFYRHSYTMNKLADCFHISTDHKSEVRTLLVGGRADPDLHHHQHNRVIPCDGISNEAYKYVLYFPSFMEHDGSCLINSVVILIRA